MGRIPWLVAVAAWLAVGMDETKAADRARFELEVGAAAIDGPGEGLQSIKDKAVRDIDEGDGRFLALRWNATERWYLKGGYSRSTARYASPLDPACPLSASVVVPDVSGLSRTCQTEVADRIDGRIDEHLTAYELVAGYQLPPSARWTIDAALGLGILRWESQDDVEAYDTSLCRSGLNRNSPLSFPPVAGCRPVTPRSRKAGAIAGLNVIYSVTPRVSLSVGGRFHDYRHLIWRSDVVNRLRLANCAGVEGRCPADGRRRFAELEQGSWHWYSAVLDYAVTDRWHAVLQYETGGNRDWDIASLAVRYTW